MGNKNRPVDWPLDPSLKPTIPEPSTKPTPPGIKWDHPAPKGSAPKSHNTPSTKGK
jgi:hypothetical protein